MFNWLSDLFENVWNFIIVIIIIGCIAGSFPPHRETGKGSLSMQGFL